MTHTCPQCASKRTHRSRRRGVMEHLVAVSGLKLRRCHDCSLRFGAMGNSVLLVKDINRVAQKALMLVLMAFAMVAVVAVVLWLSRKEATPSAALYPVVAASLLSA